MCLLVAARDSPSRSAARVKPPASTTAAKTRTFSKRSIPGRIVNYFADNLFRPRGIINPVRRGSLSLQGGEDPLRAFGGSHVEIRRRSAFPAAGMGRRREGLFRRRGPRLRIPRNDGFERGGGHHIGNKVGAYQTFEAGRTCNVSGACHWTMNVAASNGHGKLYADCYSVSPCGVFVPAEFAGEDARPISPACRFRSAISPAATTRPSRGSSNISSPRQIKLSFDDGLLFSRMELSDRRQGAGGFAVQRAVLFRRAARLPQNHRHDLHDGLDGHRHAGSGGRAQIFPRAAPRAARHRSAAGALYALLQERIPGALPRPDGYAALGTGRAAGVRALLEADFRRILRVDRAARHFPARRNGHAANTKPRFSAKPPNSAYGAGVEVRCAPAQTRRGTFPASAPRYSCCSASSDSCRTA